MVVWWLDGQRASQASLETSFPLGIHEAFGLGVHWATGHSQNSSDSAWYHCLPLNATVNMQLQLWAVPGPGRDVRAGLELADCVPCHEHVPAWAEASLKPASN